MTLETAVQRHDRMVREEREQAERVRSAGENGGDFWQTLARNFRPPAEADADPTADLLADLVGAAGQAIDVGAGGGRIAIPLAGRIRRVVAVEPSPSMRAVLAEELARYGVSTIEIVPSSWEEAEVDRADLVFAANVTYGVQRIEPFLRKMEAIATRWAVLIVLTDPPQTPFAPFWRFVHGEKRLRLPCRDELLDVLAELGAAPEVVPLPPVQPGPFGTRQETIDSLRFRLFVGPGTPADARLRAAIDALTEERGGLLWPKAARPRERQIIRFSTSPSTARR